MFRTRASELMLAALAPVTLGQAKYVSQDRWISVIDCQGVPPETITAPDLGPFDEVVYSMYTYSGADQISTLEPWLIKAKGKGLGRKQNGCCGWGQSHCSVVFDIDHPTAWNLSGYVGVGCNGDALWKLSGPSVNIVYEKKYPETGYFTLNETGVLDPGTYEITVETSAYCYFAPGGVCTAGFNFDFAMSDLCDPDCDGSGSLDIDDFICFQTLFAIGDPKADCDGDGQLLIDDFICFQTQYAVGC